MLRQMSDHLSCFSIYLNRIIYGLRRKKTGRRGLGNNKGTGQPVHPQSDQRLCYSLIGKYHI